MTNPNDWRPLLDVARAAEHLAVSEHFIRRLVRERRIAVVRLGREMRFDPNDLATFNEWGRSGEIVTSSAPSVSASHVSADAALPRLPLDRSIDGEKLSLNEKRIVQEYLRDYSCLKALRDCSAFYLPEQRRWNSCRHPLCWQEARHRASSRAADLRKRAAGYRSLVIMTLSLQSAPSTQLFDAWDALDGVRAAFIGGRWLRAQVDAYRWHTEITQGPQGWHPHASFLLAVGREMSNADLHMLEEACTGRWSKLAAAAGHHADPASQYFMPVKRTPGRAIGYLCKGPMALSGNSRTPGRILLDAALQGDADAAAAWKEIEIASVGRRWQGTGGEFRRSIRT